MQVKTATDLGSLIREQRKSLGWDQAELARRVAVSRQWIIDIEKGKPRAELGLVLRTLTALGLTVWVGDPPTPAGEVGPSIDIDAIVEAGKTR